jgi:hypothetical protein
MTPPITRTHNPVAIQKNPNPQGKGMVPVLRDWATLQPTVSGPKSPPDFLRDYCISSLVLAAHFRFKPVVGRDYFLYGSEQGWSLSLIAPQEWGQRKAGQFVACCRLRPDMTWQMDTSRLEEHSPAVVMASTFIRAFVDTLAGQASITEHLPFYVAALPYYQRLLATALASSLQRTLPSNSDDMYALLRSHLVPPLLASAARGPALLAAGSGQ